MKIELAHDLLAKKIHEKASQEDRKLLEIRQFIQQRFAHFKKNQVLLARDDINYIKPYLEKIALKPHEIRFVERSKSRLLYYAFAVGTLAVLVLGIISYFIVQNERIQERSRERMAAQLARYREMNDHAQKLSEALVESQEGLNATKEELRLALLELQAQNDTLVSKYARYKVEQTYSKKQLEQELNIARSAKLSELAAASVEKDRRYAFQLADKAWHLNSDNEQAMQVLHQIADRRFSGPLSKQHSYNIIKRYRDRWGSLNDEALAAIFNSNNNVTAQREAPIVEQVQETIEKPVPPPTSSVPPPRDIKEEVQQQKDVIQQQMKDLKLQIQQQRPDIEQRPSTEQRPLRLNQQASPQ